MMSQKTTKTENSKIFCKECGQVLATTEPGKLQCPHCGCRTFTVGKMRIDKRQTFQRDLRQHGPI